MKQYLYTPLVWTDRIRASVWYPESRPWSKDNDMTFYKALAVMPEQTHSLNVGIVERRSTRFPDTDALVTFNPEIPLGIVTADCVPILLYASDVKGIAAVHAGWKGTLGGILDRTLDVLINHGATPENIYAIFGPSISMERYEVDVDLAQKFRNEGFDECISYPDAPIAKPHLDLQEANRLRMIRHGVPAANIITCPLCTFGHPAPDSEAGNAMPLLQSYRRDGASSGRNLSLISMLRMP